MIPRHLRTRLKRDLSSTSRFATFLDWLRWMRISYVMRYRFGFDNPQRPLRIRFNELPDGVLLRPGTHDYAVAGEIFLGREYAFLDKLHLRADATIVDLGANVGVFLKRVRRLWPSSRCVALEPEPGNFAILKQNAESDGTRTQVAQAAIGHVEGTTTLDSSRGTWATRTGPVSAGGSIPVVTMAGLLARYHLERVDLLKCDIEGAEAALFNDCAGWIGAIDNLIVEVHSPYSLENLELDLKRAGSSLRRAAVAPSKDTALFVRPSG